MSDECRSIGGISRTAIYASLVGGQEQGTNACMPSTLFTGLWQSPMPKEYIQSLRHADKGI